jgi:hypothetical protein
MTLRELTEEDIEFFRKDCEECLAERQKSANHPINPVYYKLAYSDGAKAVLARVDALNPPDA